MGLALQVQVAEVDPVREGRGVSARPVGQRLNQILWMGVMGSAVVLARYALVDEPDPWAHPGEGTHGVA